MGRALRLTLVPAVVLALTACAAAPRGGAEGERCAAVAPAPDVDPFDMRLPSLGPAAFTEVRGDRFTDLFLAGPSGKVRVGARREWGGAVVFFGLGADPRSNVIDTHDTGRGLQIALYDRARQRQGCAWDAGCIERPSACEGAITFLGWNPVQGGDECGRGSRALSSRLAGDAFEIVAQPLQWNPDWDARDCSTTPCGLTRPRPVGVRYRTTLRFVAERIVEIAYEVTNDEAVGHPPSLQEFPTLYVDDRPNGPGLSRLMDGGGRQVDADRPGGKGMLTGDFLSPEPWVTWQNAAGDYGVGLAMDAGTREFIVWRDDGGRTRFRNVRPRLVFALPAGGRVRGISYLGLGAEPALRQAFSSLLKRRAPFGALEVPAAGATASAAGMPVTVQGWALDTGAIDRVALIVDGVERARVTVDRRRPDVCAQYPRYGACPFAGFSTALPAALFDAPCPRLLRVVAIDADGNQRVLGERLVGR